MSDRLPLLQILLISHTVDAILPPMESNRQRDSVSMGKDTKKGVPERRPPGSPEKEHEKRDLPATPFGLVEGPYPESPPDVRFENHFSL